MAEPMPCLNTLKYPLKVKYLSVSICKQNIRVSGDLNLKKIPNTTMKSLESALAQICGIHD